MELKRNAEVPSRDLEALQERALRSGFDFIDFWAVDFDHKENQPFKHYWQDYRLRKDRSLKLESDCAHRYDDSRSHQICVKVILDRDLAAMYGVETKELKRAVRRNAVRFPEDFMFELTVEELAEWRRQYGTSKSVRMGLRYPPMAFTEQGVAMLSSVLNSERAILVNIAETVCCSKQA